MSILSNKEIVTNEGTMQTLEETLEAVEAAYSFIDTLNGCLCGLVEELPQKLDGDDADLENIRDFYMGLPVWSQMDDVKESLTRIRDRMKLKE